LERTPSLLAQTSDNAKYEDSGPGPYPLLASVAKRHSAAQPWVSVADGFDMVNLRSRFDTNVDGRRRYFGEVVMAVFAALCPVAGADCLLGDVPGEAASALVDFVALGNNPARSGPVVIRFGLAAADRVDARVFDVAGRMVRRLVDRRFAAGEHALTWDGIGD